MACLFEVRPQGRHFPLVGDGGEQTPFRFTKCCLWVSYLVHLRCTIYLAYLRVHYLVHNWYVFEVADERFDKMSARVSFLPKDCGAVAEKAMKLFIFMYHEPMSIFLVFLHSANWP